MSTAASSYWSSGFPTNQSQKKNELETVECFLCGSRDFDMVAISLDVWTDRTKQVDSIRVLAEKLSDQTLNRTRSSSPSWTT